MRPGNCRREALICIPWTVFRQGPCCAQLTRCIHLVKISGNRKDLKRNRQETVETVSDFIFLGSKITADGDCSHEIKRCLLLGRKVMNNLDSIFKSRDITLPTKVRLVEAMIFLWSCMDVRVGLWRRLSAEELMLLNCGVGEDSWESLEVQGSPTSPF